MFNIFFAERLAHTPVVFRCVFPLGRKCVSAPGGVQRWAGPGVLAGHHPGQGHRDGAGDPEAVQPATRIPRLSFLEFLGSKLRQAMRQTTAGAQVGGVLLCRVIVAVWCLLTNPQRSPTTQPTFLRRLCLLTADANQAFLGARYMSICVKCRCIVLCTRLHAFSHVQNLVRSQGAPKAAVVRRRSLTADMHEMGRVSQCITESRVTRVTLSVTLLVLGATRCPCRPQPRAGGAVRTIPVGQPGN